MLSAGRVIRGVRHPVWTAEGAMDLVGKRLDLEAAFRHVAAKGSDAHASVTAVWNPS